MNRTKRLGAKAFEKIINRHDRDHVGYLTKWNNGELQKAWFDRPCSDVVVEMFEVDVPEASWSAWAVGILEWAGTTDKLDRRVR